MKDEAKVGITITIGIILFIVMMLVLKNVSLYENKYRLIVQANDAAGILKGDPVTIAGVQIGRVEEIWLENTEVYLRIWVKEKYQLPKDSKAFIKTLSVMGEKYVGIQPGISSTILQEGDRIPGFAVGDVTEIAAGAQPMIESLQTTLHTLQLALNDTACQNIQQTLQNVKSITSDLNRLIAQSKNHLSESTRNFKIFSNNLKNISERNQQPIDSLIACLDRSTKDFSRASGKLSQTADNLEAITGQIKSQKGTLGKLIYDDRFYRHLDSLALNTNTLIKDIKKNPKKYIKISLF